MATVSKADLVDVVADRHRMTKTAAKEMVDSFFDVLGESIIEGDRVEARGFGVFNVKKTKPKPSARNPRTGEIVYVPARRKVLFKPGKLLKEVLNKPVDAPAPARSELRRGDSALRNGAT